jgi:hypothetical protein
MPDGRDTQILQVFRRELRQNGFVHRVVAESGLVLLKARLRSHTATSMTAAPGA